MHRYGPPDVLEYETVPDPEPRAGEIRIRVHAATVNRVLDVSLRAGNERARGAILPLIPGVDCAGVVDVVGSAVTRWRKGMRVAAAGIMPLDICPEDGAGYEGPTGMMGIKRPGGFAEMVAVPACTAIELPDGLDFHHAAVIMRHVPTAWNLLVNGDFYRDPGPDYYAARQPSRTKARAISQLETLGYRVTLEPLTKAG